MVGQGQPKTHSEYIQATSRVGRDPKKPGLVVTLLNLHKPRDRSHYERFRHYHETFYRAVEVSSVTPFSTRALDRGFAGAMVGLARHRFAELGPPLGAERISTRRAELEAALFDTFRARIEAQPIDGEERDEVLAGVADRIVRLLDAWQRIAADQHDHGAHLQYQEYEARGPKPLLHDLLERDFDAPDEALFRANRSLRDVEPNVNLFLQPLHGRFKGERP